MGLNVLRFLIPAWNLGTPSFIRLKGWLPSHIQVSLLSVQAHAVLVISGLGSEGERLEYLDVWLFDTWVYSGNIAALLIVNRLSQLSRVGSVPLV